MEAMLEVIAESLLQRHAIEIRGFGTFYTKIRKPRPARNPRTGKVVMLPKRWVAIFKLNSDIKLQIQNAHKAKENHASDK